MREIAVSMPRDNRREAQKEKFEKAVKKWLDEDYSWREKLFDRVLAYFHTILPRRVRFFGLANWVVRYATIASAPALAHFIYNTITLLQASLALGALFVLHLVSAFFDRWSKSKEGTTERTEAEIWVLIGDLINSVKSEATPDVERDSSIVSALGIIHGYGRLITNSRSNEIAVSLALYKANSTSTLVIRHRNPGSSRPLGRKLMNLDYVLGHRACQANESPRVVPDLRRFGKEAAKSPTQSICRYRAILIVPMTSNRNGEVRGFLSIDCVTPHAFHGTIAERLIVTCEPLIDHIRSQI